MDERFSARSESVLEEQTKNKNTAKHSTNGRLEALGTSDVDIYSLPTGSAMGEMTRKKIASRAQTGEENGAAEPLGFL